MTSSPSCGTIFVPSVSRRIYIGKAIRSIDPTGHFSLDLTRFVPVNVSGPPSSDVRWRSVDRPTDGLPMVPSDRSLILVHMAHTYFEDRYPRGLACVHGG